MKKNLTMAQKKGITGVIFSLPLIFGMIVLFIMPLIQSFRFGLSDLELIERGFELHFAGIENFYNATRVNPNFNRHLAEAIGGLAVEQ